MYVLYKFIVFKAGFIKWKVLKNLNRPKGCLKDVFFEALSKGDYPVLKEAMGLNNLNLNNNENNRPGTAQARVSAIGLYYIQPQQQEVEIF